MKLITENADGTRSTKEIVEEFFGTALMKNGKEWDNTKAPVFYFPPRSNLGGFEKTGLEEDDIWQSYYTTGYGGGTTYLNPVGRASKFMRKVKEIREKGGRDIIALTDGFTTQKNGSSKITYQLVRFIYKGADFNDE